MQEPAVVSFDPVLRTIVKGSPLPLEYALARLGHFLGRVKIWGRSTPYGPKYGLRKKSIWVGAIWLKDLSGYLVKVRRTFVG